MLPRSSRYATPLPTSQVAVLMGVRLAEPIAYTVIFPFINQMVEELKVTDNPDKIGFYSGLIESVFALVQFFTVYHWAKLSDRVGRRPVVLIGLLGVAISGTLFGLSTSFWMMLVFRCLSGALNGNVAVIKASLGDITDDTNSTEAFAMYGLTWTVGAIIGNAIGGYLAHPAERFPELFGKVQLFVAHPFLLPCLVTACCTLVGILFALFVYRESLPSLQNVMPSTPRQAPRVRLGKHKRNASSISTDMSEDDTLMSPMSPATPDKARAPADFRGPSRGQEWGFWQLIALKEVRIMSVTLFLNSFVSGAWGAASLLFFFDKNNGLSMTAPAIGAALSLNGFWTIVCQLVFLTRIRNALGISRAYKLLSFGWIPVWFLLPHLRNVLEWAETPIPTVPTAHQAAITAVRYAETRSWTVSIAVNMLLSFVTFVGMANSLLMVLVNQSAPDRSALGAVNGISTAVGCMARVIGPSLVSALFAISMDEKILNGRLWWIVMVILACINFTTALFVAPEHSTGGLSSIPEEEEEEALVGEEGRDSWDGATPISSPIAPIATTARIGMA